MLCYSGAQNLSESSDYVLISIKRLRCLVVLLSLALASGNAHAVLHLPVAHAEPCPEEHTPLICARALWARARAGAWAGA
jgi:hypothetical protein